MRDKRMSSAIATETFSKEELSEDSPSLSSKLSYPYFTCELGGGMMPAYHRRININGKELKPLVICKLGSGSNLPGTICITVAPIHTILFTLWEKRKPLRVLIIMTCLI